MEIKKTSTETLIKALEILSQEISSEDGSANITIAEAAKHMQELYSDNKSFGWHQPELCTEKYTKLVEECNSWEELCEELIERIEEIPNLKRKSTDRILIEKFYKLKGHYEY